MDYIISLKSTQTANSADHALGNTALYEKMCKIQNANYKNKDQKRFYYRTIKHSYITIDIKSQ